MRCRWASAQKVSPAESGTEVGAAMAPTVRPAQATRPSHDPGGPVRPDRWLEYYHAGRGCGRRAGRAVRRHADQALTARSIKMLDEGRTRIFERGRDAWDGTWRMVIYAVPEESR